MVTWRAVWKSSGSVPAAKGVGTPAAPEETSYSCITEMAALEAWIAEANDAGVVAVDTETTSVDPMRAELVGIALAASPGEAWYVNIGHHDGAEPLSLAAVREARPVVMEPIVNLDVQVQQDDVGSVTGDLAGRRGRVLGTRSLPLGRIVVMGQAPLSELDDYPERLKAMSGGSATFTLEMAEYEQVPEPLQVLFRLSVQPYLISLFQEDPAAAFANTTAPALIIQGSHDIQVSSKDAQALKQARADAELALIKGMGHVLRITPQDSAGQVASYNSPELPIAHELTEQISRFLTEHGVLPASS